MKILRAVALTVAAVVLLSFTAFANGKPEYKSDSEHFKQEYETKNGMWDEHFHRMRSLELSEDNPVVYASCDEILKRLDKKESFYIYFGYAKCPWCRGIVGPMLEAAKKCEVSEILYVDLLRCRDEYTAKKGQAVKLSEGADGYEELLKRFDAVLDEYTLIEKDGTEIYTGEKRIYAPTIMHIQDGTVKQIYTGSEMFTDPCGELTEEIRSDMICGMTVLFTE